MSGARALIEPGVRQRVIDVYLATQSPRAVIEATGVSRASVHRILASAGVERVHTVRPQKAMLHRVTARRAPAATPAAPVLDEDADELETVDVAEGEAPIEVTAPAPRSDAYLYERPRTRGDCEHGVRPCPWVSCTEHALHGPLSVQRTAGHQPLTEDQAVELLEKMPWSCTLDVADERPEGLSLLEIGGILDLTRERVRQIEEKAMQHARWPVSRVGLTREDVREEVDILDATRSRHEGGHGGPARFAEAARAPQPPPAHLAHLPGPAEVAAGRTFWCGHMGAPVDTALCTGRHTARHHVTAQRSAVETYRECARCEDGAALLARLGAEAAKRPARRYLPLVLAPELPTPEAPPTPPSAPVIELLATPSNDHTETATETTTMTAETAPAPIVPETHAEAPAAPQTPTERPRCGREGCKGVATRTGFCAPHSPRPVRPAPAVEAPAPKPTAKTVIPAASRPHAKTVTTVCAAWSCVEIVGLVRSNTPREYAHLCAYHRKRASDRVMHGGKLAEVLAEIEGPGSARATAPAASARAPVPEVATQAASKLAEGLALARRHAAIVARLGGVERAEVLAVHVEAHGATVILDALAELASLGGAS